MIDFSNVKSIVIPEGEVSIIARGSEILWRKQKYKRELLYIESTGKEYIDTGVIPSPNVGAKLTYHITGNIAGDSCLLLIGSDSWRWGFSYRLAGSILQIAGLCVSGASWVNYTVPVKLSTIEYNFDGERNCYLDGELLRENLPAGNVTTTGGIYLFASNYNGTGTTWRHGVFRVYALQMVDGGNLVRDFIPVLDMDDVPCLFDKVSGELFYNQGAGAFKYEELPRLPLEYQEVEYLESTGTQYIDAGVTINTATDDVEYVFQCTEQNVYKWFYGEHDNNARFGLGSGDGANKRNVAYGNSTYKVTDTQIYNSQHTFTANQSGVFIDEAKIANFASFKSSSTLYLFSLNLSGGNYAGAAKVWSYKHSRNGVLIRDLVPCYRKSDNKPGMYDLVTNTFLTNAGTGEFLYA